MIGSGAIGGKACGMLLAPGRVGTSSPELGVPVAFGDISNFSEICEISDSRAGYMPELSYGSHMFQDLVEAQIRYHAIFNNQKTPAYHPELFAYLPDRFPDICGADYELEGMIQVREPRHLYCWLDTVKNRCACGTALPEYRAPEHHSPSAGPGMEKIRSE